MIFSRQPEDVLEGASEELGVLTGWLSGFFVLPMQRTF